MRVFVMEPMDTENISRRSRPLLFAFGIFWPFRLLLRIICFVRSLAILKSSTSQK